MNSKMNSLTSVILFGFATSAVSAEPPNAPSFYDNGSQEISIDLSAAEMAAYACIQLHFGSRFLCFQYYC